MSNKKTSRGRWTVIAAIGVALLAGMVMGGALWYLWRPQHLVWARNAYGMAQVGAWSGTDWMRASFAYWFFELRGRTVVTVLAVGAWLFFSWLRMGRVLRGWDK